MVDKMNGKVLKVAQYNLEFGSTDRYVNVFGCFKYKPNGNMYVVYADVDTKYPIIYYGSGHLKGTTLLSMRCRDINESEIIKEYIFQLTNNEALNNFEIYFLETIETIELIGSDKIEVKPEVITSLVDITLPKKEEPKAEEQATTVKTKPKKKTSKTLLIILLILLIGATCYVCILPLTVKNTVAKKIVCKKEYQHNILKATVDEENTYNFNFKDSLESIDNITIYQFNEEDYQDFILRGTYYKYLPDDSREGGYKQDDTNYTFKIMSTEEVDTSYNKPTNYEEVFSYYKKEGYTCTEKVDE